MVDKACDVAVVGAGSAGAVVAARLSEDPVRRVVLIEAGVDEADPDIANPLAWAALADRPYDWAFRTTPQTNTANRAHAWPRGRLVGGSSCLNAMAHMRGHREDFTPWAAAGGERWSYAGLRRGFEASEAMLGLTRDPALLHPVTRAFLDSARGLGVPDLGNHNGAEMIGTAPNTLSLRDGQRVSVADAYLQPAVRARPNLDLKLAAIVDRLHIEGNRVTGIEIIANGERQLVRAAHVVLSAGAIGSPLILMRSGIGPAADLARAGVTCRIDLPGVGANLRDHLLLFGHVYRTKAPIAPSRLQHSESMIYLRSDDLSATTGQPDLVIGCPVAPIFADGVGVRAAYGEAFTLLSGPTQPTSVGRLTLAAADPFEPPRIDPRYLSTDHDRLTMRRAFRIAREIAAAMPLAAISAGEISPGPGVATNAEIDRFLALGASTHHHPCGTCRMGEDPAAVVDGDLTVREIAGISVVDASIMPTLTSGPIHASVLAIAETWSSCPPDAIR